MMNCGKAEGDKAAVGARTEERSGRCGDGGGVVVNRADQIEYKDTETKRRNEKRRETGLSQQKGKK